MHWLFRGGNREFAIYFGVYIAYLLYGIWVIGKARFRIYDMAKIEFGHTHSVWLTPRDNSNYEFESFRYYIKKCWQWYINHLIVNACIRRVCPRWQNLSHILITWLMLSQTMHWLSLATLTVLLLSFFIVSNCVSRICVWLLAAIWISLIHSIKTSELYLAIDYNEYFTLLQVMSWSILRSCSFCLQRVITDDSKYQFPKRLYSLEYFLGYTLYFPCLVYGPFMNYHRYLAAVFHSLPQNKFITFLTDILRVLVWWLLLHCASHYLYVFYMASNLAAVKMIDSIFGLHAVGYFMGQFFFLFYFISYGLGIAYARYDGMDPPNRPRCIGRIHFYSDMWKTFDQGLYEFLFDHIYCQLCERSSSKIRKIFATAITFGFVFIWHGCHYFVLIWSILNFICLIVENAFKYCISTNGYRMFLKHNLKLSDGGIQRVNALLATQIFIPAAFSNVFFISGQEVGTYLMTSAYTNGWWNYLALTFCSYCFFQCSQIIKQRQKESQQQQRRPQYQQQEY